MTKFHILAAIASLAIASPAFAEGDIEKGEKTFKQCKSCHMIANGDEVLLKGGKTGPNLYGIVGRVMGSEEDFKYGSGLITANEAGIVWDEEAVAEYVGNPKDYLQEVTGDSGAKTKMTFKLKKGGEDVAAFLATMGPASE
ncbi:c-type cytochrome [Falsihalocynthiibacter arcticus]|uniref:Cytochrome C n=1 Tax=Falsihalocynthiibacter arcticus TaxID=1579316 RepID=A0A126UV16_9RHOB|nr:cytochrome c550 [Falsihalocynthiibacter arcticus]AML49902.1 cytochrome C [Falsihalocynthiibacter arcticus]